MLSTCAVFVWQSRHRGVAQFGRAPRSGRGGRGFKSRHLDQRDAGPNFALGSALFYCLHTDEWFVVVQGFLCVTLDSISHWVQRYLFLLHSYALRNCAVRTGRRLCSGSKFPCVTLDPKSLWIQRYFYVCSRTRGLRMHIFAARRCMKYIKKGRKAAFLFIGPVGKYLTTALLYDTI